LSNGKNLATIKVEIQFAASAQLWVAPTAFGPTSSEARINGTGPNPTAKQATNNRLSMADKAFWSIEMPSANRTELIPILATLRRIQVFRLMLSDNGEQTSVTMRLRTEIITANRGAAVEMVVCRSDTLYMMMLLIPVNY
jgi:hypothetical protein